MTPSAKYCVSSLVLKFLKGMTAMDLFKGSDPGRKERIDGTRKNRKRERMSKVAAAHATLLVVRDFTVTSCCGVPWPPTDPTFLRIPPMISLTAWDTLLI